MITTITGKNTHALQAALHAMVADARSQFGDMGVERFDAQEVDADQILQAVQSLPFLVPQKLVVVQNAQANTELMNRVDELIDRTADTVDVVLIGPVFDKRKSSFSVLKKRTKLREFAEPKPYELPSWVVGEAKQLHATISKNDAQYLVDRVGADQMLLKSELKKLTLNTSTITRADIDLHTEQSSQSTVFEMLDAAFSGASDRTIALYRDQRKQRVEPHYIVAMLTWQLHALALAVYADPQTEQTLVGAGQSPYAARKALSLARRITRAQLRTYISDLCELDGAIKTSAEPDAALELYLLNLGRS